MGPLETWRTYCAPKFDWMLKDPDVLYGEKLFKYTRIKEAYGERFTELLERIKREEWVNDEIRIELGKLPPFKEPDIIVKEMTPEEIKRALWKPKMPHNYIVNGIERMLICIKAGKEIKCEMCGLEKFLTTHHLDCNDFNNTPENLKILCWNCHFGIMHRKGYTKERLEEVIKRGED